MVAMLDMAARRCGSRVAPAVVLAVLAALACGLVPPHSFVPAPAPSQASLRSEAVLAALATAPLTGERAQGSQETTGQDPPRIDAFRCRRQHASERGHSSGAVDLVPP